MSFIEFSDVIEKRVSIRSYTTKKVPEDDIYYLLDCARKAPSWMNKQCWRFIVIRDRNVIKEISKMNIINRWMKNAPIITIICADPKLSGYEHSIEYYIVDTAIAMEHLILAATDKGLGTCWIVGFNEDKLKELLEIPPRIKIVALTPIGYPKETENLSSKVRKTIVRSTKRKSLQEIVHWDHW